MNDRQGEINAKRDAAARARRLSAGLTNLDDIKKLRDLADVLDAEADALSGTPAAPPPPLVTQTQMQVQQAPPAKDDGSDDPKG
jgi:hypothetical protein